MKARWPLWIAVAAALAGSAILFAWFQKYWPATQWTVLPRAQLLEKARLVSERFGVKTNDSTVSDSASVDKSVALYAEEHPADLNARAVSPLSILIKLPRNSEVRVDSAGAPLHWHAPDGFKPPRTFAPDADAAHSAFVFMAGPQAGSYKDPVREAGDDAREEDFIWKKPLPIHSEVRERIKVVTKDSVVQSARHHVYLSSDEDDDSDTGDSRAYWNILGGIFGLICTLSTLFAISIYVLWLARKVVNHQFPLRIAAGLMVLLLAGFAGAFSGDNVFTTIVTGVMIVCFVAVGRGIFAGSRQKWFSLEQLCLLVPTSKQMGQSVAAGLLFSPMLVAIPFLIAGCGLIPEASVLPHNAELLYSHAPALESMNFQADIYLLGFFGFGVPALQRLLRVSWLCWPITLVVGTLFFAHQTKVITGPMAAPLMAGLLTLAVFWFLYAQFDLLAVLTLPLAGGLLLTLLMRTEKGSSIGTLVGALGALLLVAFWFTWRGQPVSEGDPRATIPALSGFRAEREKLRAEFSVARRAQQDMLPQTPPNIPGYSLAASCTPSLEVGGDLYDFLKLPDGRIGIGVADVSGKGVPAALYMTLTKGLLSAVTKNNSELAHVVEEVNRHLHGVTRKKVFVTMALGFLDAEKRVLECARAGHNPVVWRQTARNLTELVAPGGLGLGITASRVFGTQLKVAQMALSEGDAVVFYSDGITEAMNSELEQFGEQRLMDAVELTDKLDAAATRDSILAVVRSFLDGVHPQDDMTLVVLRVGTTEMRG